MDNLEDKKTRFVKILLYALPGVLPAIVLGGAFAINGVYPFGNKQIMIGDFWVQYYPFISDYWHKLREGNSLLWSWSAGAGHDYIPLIAYYMASPLNLLAALFPHEFLREVLTAFLLVKLSLAGFFMSIYLRYVSKRDSILLPVFASMYALSSYALAYYCNIMWFDTFALLPLVMLGVHKLVDEGKFKLYVLSLAAAVIFNFYIGFFVCVFTALWFFALCAARQLELKELLREFMLIAVFSAIAIGMTAFLTLPAYNALQHTYSSVYGNAFPDALRLRHSFFDVLGNFITFTPIAFVTGLPNLYSGIICVMLLPVFLLSEKISRGEKLCCTIVTAFLTVSTNVNVLDYMWHGFSYPAGFPSRYSFIASFVLIFIAYRAYALTESFRMRDIIAMGGTAALFLIMAALGPQETEYIIWSAVLCVAYLILFALLVKVKDKTGLRRHGGKSASPRKTKGGGESLQPRGKETRTFAINLMLFAVILGELSFFAYIGVKTAGTTDRENYPLEYNNIQRLLDMRRPAENDFYRTEFCLPVSWNDNSLYGYNGISVWANNVDARVTNFMEGLGLSGSGTNNIYTYYAETSPLTNAFLNIRYLIDDVGLANGDIFWNRAAEADGILLLENNRYLPLGFMVGAQTAGYEGFAGAPYSVQKDKFGRGEGMAKASGAEAPGSGGAADPFSAQNDLFRRATGLDGNLFSMVDISNMRTSNYELADQGAGKLTFAATDNSAADGIFFIDYEMPAAGSLYFYVWIEGADKSLTVFENSVLHEIDIEKPYIYRAGSFEQGDLVSIAGNSVAESGEARIYAAVFDHALFEQGFARLADEALELTQFSDTRITGRITALEDGLLYTSIPHTGLWRAFVDGSEAPIITIDGAMAGIELGAGEHIVEFRYHNMFLVAGAIISAIAVLTFLAVAAYGRLKGVRLGGGDFDIGDFRSDN